jgi:hypothetical protein
MEVERAGIAAKLVGARAAYPPSPTTVRRLEDRVAAIDAELTRLQDEADTSGGRVTSTSPASTPDVRSPRASGIPQHHD